MPKLPALPAAPPPRIRIAAVEPQVDGGRWPVRRCAGDVVRLSADVFRDGHEALRAAVQFRGPRRRRWEEAPMAAVDAHHAGVRW